MDYDQRRIHLNDLPKLKEKRVRGDMIETYKILTGKEHTKWNRFFQIARVKEDRDPELAHFLKLFPKKPRLNNSYRITNQWNELSKEEVQLMKTSGFKEKYI